jgi:hypothetical protein
MEKIKEYTVVIGKKIKNRTVSYDNYKKQAKPFAVEYFNAKNPGDILNDLKFRGILRREVLKIIPGHYKSMRNIERILKK